MLVLTLTPKHEAAVIVTPSGDTITVSVQDIRRWRRKVSVRIGLHAPKKYQITRKPWDGHKVTELPGTPDQPRTHTEEAS